MTTIRLTDITPAQLQEMREQIRNCDWPDLDPADVDQLTDAEIFAGIRAHFDGGITGFLKAYEAFESFTPAAY